MINENRYKVCKGIETRVTYSNVTRNKSKESVGAGLSIINLYSQTDVPQKVRASISDGITVFCSTRHMDTCACMNMYAYVCTYRQLGDEHTCAIHTRQWSNVLTTHTRVFYNKLMFVGY